MSQKTKIEQNNIISCHYEDGLTMTKFFIKLKTKKLNIKNEYQLSNSLYELRKEGVNFFEILLNISQPLIQMALLFIIDHFQIILQNLKINLCY